MMAMQEYFILLRLPELEPDDQMQLSVIPYNLLLFFLLLPEMYVWGERESQERPRCTQE